MPSAMPSQQKREINVIELSFFLFCIGVGCGISRMVGFYFGLFGFIAGFLSGIAILPFITWTIFRVRKQKKPSWKWWY
jgi:hypothetical protein